MGENLGGYTVLLPTWVELMAAEADATRGRAVTFFFFFSFPFLVSRHKTQGPFVRERDSEDSKANSPRSHRPSHQAARNPKESLLFPAGCLSSFTTSRSLMVELASMLTADKLWGYLRELPQRAAVSTLSIYNFPPGRGVLATRRSIPPRQRSLRTCSVASTKQRSPSRILGLNKNSLQHRTWDPVRSWAPSPPAQPIGPVHTLPPLVWPSPGPVAIPPPRTSVFLAPVVALALVPVRCRHAGTLDRLEIDDDVIAKHLGLRHDVEMVLKAVHITVAGFRCGDPCQRRGALGLQDQRNAKYIRHHC